MCGLVGAFGNIDDEAKSIFKWMLHFDVTRGPHSTGITLVGEDNAVNTYKEVGMPHLVWLGYPDAFEANGVPKGNLKLMMGHNRWATKGEVIKENAHPFTFGHITGAHNGTLQDYDLKVLDHNTEYDVDSKVLYRNIEIHGIEPIWKKVFGAMALTWWDAEESTFNIIRNSQRPLYTWQFGHTLFWASEKWILETAKNMANCQVKSSPQEVPVNKLFSFTYEGGKLYMFEENFRPFVSSGATNTGQSTTTTKTETGKNKEITLKLKEWIPTSYPQSNCAGHFISESVNEDEPKEYITYIYGATSNAATDVKEAMFKHHENGGLFKLAANSTYVNHNGVITAPMSQLTPVFRVKEPNDTDTKLDALGQTIYYKDWSWISMDRCAACNSTIPLDDWKNLHKYIVFANEEFIFCPDCQDPQLMQSTLEYLNMHKVVQNWSA